MNKLLKTQAIVIRSKDFGEADRLITLFSGAYGLLHAIVKGARKPKSRLAGCTGFLTRAHFVLYKGRTFYTVTQCDEINSFKNFEFDDHMCRYYFACAITEITSYIAVEGESNYPLYHILVKTIDGLDNSDKPENYFIYFLLRSLKIAGFMPQLNTCVRCGSPVDASNNFDITNGGIVCDKCTKDNNDIYKIDIISLGVLRYMQKAGIKAIEHVKISDGTLYSMVDLFSVFISYHFGSYLKSLQFIEKVGIKNGY